MGPEQMEAGSDNGGLEQIGTWENEYLGIWVCGEMGIWGKYIFGGIGHRGKWALVQIGKWQMDIWGKGVPQVPGVHFPQMFTNGHWGKWALGANGHLGKRGTPSALCPSVPVLICLKFSFAPSTQLSRTQMSGI